MTDLQKGIRQMLARKKDCRCTGKECVTASTSYFMLITTLETIWPIELMLAPNRAIPSGHFPLSQFLVALQPVFFLPTISPLIPLLIPYTERGGISIDN